MYAIKKNCATCVNFQRYQKSTSGWCKALDMFRAARVLLKPTACEEWQQGEADRGLMLGLRNPKTMNAIYARLNHARTKHPVFAKDRLDAFAVIEDEFREFRDAVGMESPERQRDEALDVIATCVRFINEEWEEGDMAG